MHGRQMEPMLKEYNFISTLVFQHALRGIQKYFYICLANFAPAMFILRFLPNVTNIDL